MKRLLHAVRRDNFTSLFSTYRPWVAVAFIAALLADARPAIAQMPAESTQPLAELSRAFRHAYEQVRPAVVLIEATSRSQQRRVLPPFHPEIPEDFRGMGSGTIVSDDGYILSNYHVVSGADSIQVTLADRRTYRAKVTGFDSLIDIALLKVEAQDLPTVQLADSDRLQIGDWVLAIGHPLGMGTTLTHGIVSALGRQAGVLNPRSDEENRYAIESFIQTNAVINPGNSGGPLLDLQGRVVGINTAISTRTGYYIGYGLAVPTNLAREVVDDLLVHGRIVRGHLGVTMESEMTQELIRKHGLNMEWPRGVYLKQVQPNSPAERGGLLVGDVVLSLDGIEVNHFNDLQTLIYGRDPGETINLQIMRQNQVRHVAVVLGEREDDRLLSEGHQRMAQLGFSVESLPAELATELGFVGELAAELGFEQGEEPVVVVEVDPEGLAADKGIQVRDVITEVDQERVTSLEQFVRFVSGLEEGQSALFWFWRPETGINVRTLKIPE